MKPKNNKVVDNRFVITKAEMTKVLGVRHLEITLFENAVRIPKTPSRKGYTFNEYKRLSKKAKEFYGTSLKRGSFINSF